MRSWQLKGGRHQKKANGRLVAVVGELVARVHGGNLKVTRSVVGLAFQAVLCHVTQAWWLWIVMLWLSTAATVAGRPGQSSCTARRRCAASNEFWT